MKNYKGEGESVSFTAGASYDAGDVVVLGDRAAVVAGDVASGSVGQADLEGVYELAKEAVAMSVGDKLYWDANAENVTKTSSGNKAIGHAHETVASGVAVIDVNLGAF